MALYLYQNSQFDIPNTSLNDRYTAVYSFNNAIKIKTVSLRGLAEAFRVHALRDQYASCRASPVSCLRAGEGRRRVALMTGELPSPESKAGCWRFLTLIQCFERRFETKPSRPMRQTARKRSGPISPRSDGLMEMPLGPASEHALKIGLAKMERRLAQIFAIERKHIEGTQLHFVIVFA